MARKRIVKNMTLQEQAEEILQIIQAFRTRTGA